MQPLMRKVPFKCLLVPFLFLIASIHLPALPVLSSEAMGTPVRSLPRLVDVGADRCPSCKELTPILEEIRREYAESLEVIFVDVWKNPTKAIAYRVRMIPTLIFYDASGQELYRHLGYCSKKDILKKFEEHRIPLKQVRKK